MGWKGKGVEYVKEAAFRGVTDSLCNERSGASLYMWEETRHGSFTSNKTRGEHPWRTDAPSSAPKQALSLTHAAERHTVEYAWRGAPAD